MVWGTLLVPGVKLVDSQGQDASSEFISEIWIKDVYVLCVTVWVAFTPDLWQKTRYYSVRRELSPDRDGRVISIMDTIFWILGYGYYVMDTISWILCSGYYIVYTMLWILCHGYSVVDNMFWILCYGYYVLDTMLWILCYGYRVLVCVLVNVFLYPDACNW